MPRIRSIHPGFWTDSAVIGLTFEARLLSIGLWTECHDDGVFFWKPRELKMRLFGADSVDMDALLGELTAADIIQRATLDGREVGLVRNFLRFQRPRKPNYSGLSLGRYRTYVGLDGHGTEPGPLEEDPVPQKSGKSPHRRGEEGRGRGEEKEPSNDKPGVLDPSASPPTPSPSANGNGKYAFEAKTIRLTQHDFDAWLKAFKNIELAAELWALDDWAGQQKSWFSAVSAALAKKNRSAGDRALAIRAGAEAKATGPPDPEREAREAKAERFRGVL